MIHQLRYYFPWWRPPRKADIEEARLRWLEGRPQLCGVRMEVVSWSTAATADAARKAVLFSGTWIGSAGVVKQYGAANLTLCDYDAPVQPPSWHHVARVARMFDMKPLRFRIDRTAHGWHMLIWWSRDFRPREIVLLQCILGSDLKRETYNFARVMSGKARDWRWNLLFDYKVT